MCKRIKPDPFLSLHIKINSKWIRHLCVNPQSMKLPQENIGEALQDFGVHKDFFKERTAKTQAMKVRTDKWDYIKLRICYTAKERIDI
jgi:ribosome maturation protein Sdo1